MSTLNKNLSDYNADTIPSAKKMHFTLIVSEWNKEITFPMRDAACNTLIKHEAKPENIKVIHVPGSFELTSAARMIADADNTDAIICLGCVIKGETPHFDYICQGIAYGITELNIRYKTPCIFGVLTTLNLQQAKDRAGGKLGNKGDEAAITAIKMVSLQQNQEND